MKGGKYSSLTQVIFSLSIIDNIDNFPCLLNDSSPIDGIHIHQDYKCNHCDDMLIMSKIYMSNVVIQELDVVVGRYVSLRW